MNTTAQAPSPSADNPSGRLKKYQKRLVTRLQKAFRADDPNTIRAIIILAVFLVVFIFFQFDWLKRFELVTYDYRCQLRGTRASDPRVCVIEISDDSVSKIGRWPWNREWHASLIQILTRLGAKAIVFDVLFSEPTGGNDDALLAESIKASGRVYLAEVVENPLSENSRLLESMPQMVSAAKGGGHINLQPDVDGVMRRIPLFLETQYRKVPQLSLQVAADFYGTPMSAIEQRRGEIRFPIDRRVMTIPLDRNFNYVINWVGTWQQSFQHYSYIDVVASYASVQKGTKPLIPLENFRNKICFVGTTASGLFDIRPTPLQPSYPAVGVNLTILNNLLEKRYVRSVGYWPTLLILILLCAALYEMTRSKSIFRNAMYTVLLAIGYLATAVILFIFFNLWINVVYAVLLIVFTYFVITLFNQLAVSMERAKLFKLATRDSLTGLYNIGHFKMLMKAEMTAIAMRPGKTLSIVMSDVDHFKKTNDTYGHQMGDAVLREVANIIKNGCRSLDVAARYGGEEFILMLPGADAQECYQVAEKIRKALAARVFPHEKGNLMTTISLGVTEIDPKEQNIEEIIARADRALYEAKHGGRNRTMIAKDSPNVRLD